MVAVIFDLDGVLLDSERNYFEAERRMLAGYGVEFTDTLRRPYVGMSTRDMATGFAAQFNLDVTADELVAQKNEHYLLIAAERTTVFEPARRLVMLLAGHGIPMAVASGTSPHVIDAVLHQTGLRRYFDIVLSAETVARGKPHPDLFLATAEKLGTPARNCVVIEDSGHGVLAAHRAGMRCLAVPTPDTSHHDFATADLLVPGGMAAVDPARVLAWIRARMLSAE